jgi:hypothetical protein
VVNDVVVGRQQEPAGAASRTQMVRPGEGRITSTMAEINGRGAA